MTTNWRVIGIHNVGLWKDKTVPAISQKPENSVRLVLMSDTHGSHECFDVPVGDVFLFAGDLSDTGTPAEIGSFASWVNSLPHPVRVVIAGNHDVSMHGDYYEKNFRRYHGQRKLDASKEIARLRSVCTLLENSETTVPTPVGPLRVWGSPWSVEFCSWAFNLRSDELLPTWGKIPEGVDIVITHGPCRGHGATVMDSGVDVGDPALLSELIARVKPAMHVSGHIHEGYSVSSEAGITFINASSVDYFYRPVNRAIVVDIAPKK